MTTQILASPEYINSLLAEKRRHAAAVRLARAVKRRRPEANQGRRRRPRLRVAIS